MACVFSPLVLFKTTWTKSSEHETEVYQAGLCTRVERVRVDKSLNKCIQLDVVAKGTILTTTFK